MKFLISKHRKNQRPESVGFFSAPSPTQAIKWLDLQISETSPTGLWFVDDEGVQTAIGLAPMDVPRISGAVGLKLLMSRTKRIEQKKQNP